MTTNSYIIFDKNGNEINRVVWDGDINKWMPPTDCTAVQYNPNPPQETVVDDKKDLINLIKTKLSLTDEEIYFLLNK